MVAVLQDAAQIGPDVGIVVHNQHRGHTSSLRGLGGWRSVEHYLWGVAFRQADGTPYLHVQHLVDEFGQLDGVTLEDGKQARSLGTGLLDLLGSGQLGQRPLDQSQRRAQFVAHLGVEVELLTLHLRALLMEPGTLEEIEIDAHDDGQQQHNEADGQQRDGALRVEFLQIGVGHFVQLVEIFRLAYSLFVLHQQHTGIVTGDEGRHQLDFLLVGFPVEDIHRQLQQLVAVRRIDIGGIED